MPVLIYERPESRPFSVSADTEEVTRTYFVSGTNDEQEVYELLILTSPVFLGRMVRKQVKAQPLAGGNWFADVMYQPGEIGEPGDAVGTEPTHPEAPSPLEILGPSYSIDTTGATVHITQAISTSYRRTAADGAGAGVGSGADEKLAIGLTKDRVEGTDIYAPAFTFSKTVQRANVNLLYINTALYGLVGKTNNSPFYTFAPGEVLYLGCSGNFTHKERWTLTHKFACQPNEANLSVGGGITIPKKNGWEYVWVGYKPGVVNNQVLQVPHTAYVQQVYKSGNFALLEIGT
jgi:hypothetical protein